MLKAVVLPEAAASPARGPSSPTVAAMPGEFCGDGELWVSVTSYPPWAAVTGALCPTITIH